VVEFAAVGKTVGGNIENAHEVGLIEGKRAIFADLPDARVLRNDWISGHGGTIHQEEFSQCIDPRNPIPGFRSPDSDPRNYGSENRTTSVPPQGTGCMLTIYG